MAKRERGGVPSQVELDKLKKDNRNLGKPSRFVAFLPQRPIQPGERFKPSADVVKEMFGRDSGEIEQVEFVFNGVNERGAEFSTTWKLREQKPGSTFVMTARGTIILDSKTAWPILLELRGDVSLSGKGQKPSQSVEGKGTVEMKMSATYH